MSKIAISENINNVNNLLYLQKDLKDLFSHSGCSVNKINQDGRYLLSIEFPDIYNDVYWAEIADRIAEIIVISYKYNFFKKEIHVNGLNEKEQEILFASLIAADFEDDKKYTFDRIKHFNNIAIDGMYNFRLIKLKKKWEDIVGYVPQTFINSQLKEFISYLIENKNKKVYVDNGKVYDCHYKRLIRSELLTGTEELTVIREVILSNCGFVNLNGELPKEDEFYLKEYYGDKISFREGYFN